MRIDAHQHFWRLADRAGAWPPPQLAPIHRNVTPDQLLPHLQRHGIAATVLVQSLPSDADTQYLLVLAERHPFVAAVVGWVDLKAADAAHQIGQLARHPKLRGLRPMLQDLAPDDWIDDAALAPAVAAMLAHGLTFDALVLARHLPALLRFAERFPALPICIDHGAKPPLAAGPWQPWADGLARLAALPQVCCKLSGLVTEAAPAWQVAQLQPYVQHVLALFGPERVLWGSDWPVLELATDYDGWVDASTTLLAALTAPQREQVLGLNAQRFYRIAAAPDELRTTNYEWRRNLTTTRR